MVHVDTKNLCSKCSGPSSFRPRVNIDLDLNDSSMRSPLSMREMIPLCNEDLDNYDAEIARLQSQIMHVQAQKKRLMNHKSQIHFLLSSFRHFPNEVLCLIFESTCTENLLQEYPWPYDDASDDVVEPRTHLSSAVITYLPALVISAVCTRWRSLALASPTLWARIKLDISLHKPSNDSHTVSSLPDSGFIRTIQLYLDRSVNTPLTISLDAAGYDQIDAPAVKLLLDHDHRWKSFAYSGDHDLGSWIYYNPSFPNLETLMIESGYDIPSEDYTCFNDAPNIRHVLTEGQISNLPLTWNHLTSLDIRMFENEDMNILRRFPALTILTLRNIDLAYGPGIISLVKLESFTVMDPAFDGTPLLLESTFSSFTTPSLKELIITQEFNCSKLDWPPNTFSAFISRSACVLTTLSLSEVKISDLDLIAALRLLPSLVEFVTHSLVDLDGGSPITTHFISSLNASSTPSLLPKLRSLSMMINDNTFDDATFIEMVSSRWLPTASSQAAVIGIDCLRSVYLYFSKLVVDEDVYEPLWQLDDMGMCVVIDGQE